MHALDVRCPKSVRLAIGMADFITVHGTLFTYLTKLPHDKTSCVKNMLNSESYVNIIGPNMQEKLF